MQMECVDTPAGLEKRLQLKTCDTKCELGSSYEKARPGSGQCCGSCKQVACVVEGIVKELGHKWTSEDHCTQYKCVDVEGSVQVQSRLETCASVSAELKEEYVYEYVPGDGVCCGVHKQTACKVNGDVYQVRHSVSRAVLSSCLKLSAGG